MQGIPNDLRRQLRQALSSCDEFRTQSGLLLEFVDDQLRPWESSLPDAYSLKERVDSTICYLSNKETKKGDNVLAILLKILSDKYDLEDNRHAQLAYLANEIEALNRSLPGDQIQKMNNESDGSRPKSLEANPADGKMRWILDSEKMVECARAVAKIDVLRFINGQPRDSLTGTAWMVAPKLALTCRHVIEAKGPLDSSLNPADMQMQISNAILTFGFTASGNGLQYRVKSLEYPLPQSSSLDYALLRIEDRNDRPLDERGYLRLDIDSPLTMQTSLSIIQHPLGQPQQVSFDLFAKPGNSPGAILYKTPTNPGTSGSPVFNRAIWGVVAIHIGENNASGLREGLTLHSIISDIQKNREDLYREIQQAQNI